VRGQRAEIATGVRIELKDWQSSAAKRIAGNTDAAKRGNTYLLKMQNELEDMVADLDRQGKTVTAQKLARLYRQPNEIKPQTVLEIYKAFLAERKGLEGVEVAPATNMSHKTRYNRLQEYLQGLKQTGLLAEEFSTTVADRLLYWLLQKKDLKRNSANKVVRGVAQVLRWAVRREYLAKSPLDLYQYKSQAKQPIKFLTVGELEALSCLEVTDNALGIVRDCFVLQCWTGLAYADLAALDVRRDAEYHTDKAGNVRRVLRITRAKSTLQKGYECVIPLLPEAERILAHYQDEVPVFTNQAYNRGLKELGQLCGINAEKMTTHVGRKTAGTLLLNMNVPLPVVSKFLGHANVLITQKLYAELLDTTVVDAFAQLGGYSPIEADALPRIHDLEAPKPLALRPARRI
jgi:integrase